MKTVKRTLAAFAMILASFSTSASLINVGGVEWDPDNGSDFNGTTGVIYQQVDGGELSGYGRLTVLNGLGVDDLCPGCELTFHFGGFMVADDVTTPNQLEFKDGWMKFWVDDTPDAPDSEPLDLTAANTGDGDVGFGAENTLWLELAGHIFSDLDTTFIGGELGGVPIGIGYLDVTGGLAAGNIDTDSIVAPDDSLADIVFGSTFTKFALVDGILVGTGSANFSGESIPEPSTLGIFGLGLIALAFGVRNKKS